MSDCKEKTMNDEKTSTIRRFNRINDEITSLYHRASTKLGFSDSELIILYLLSSYDGELTQSCVIDLTGMSKQTVNSSVRRMEQAGWVVLGERTNHRRVIRFTEAGEELSREVIQPFMEREESLFADWTTEEKEAFLSLHMRYRDALRQMVETLPDRRGKNLGEDHS